MRTTPRFFAAFVTSLLCVPAIFAQTNPPPSDSHEMVTRQPRILTKPADRNAALDLLDRARQNYNLHDIATPYSLKVSFTTSGTSQNEGEGTMDEEAMGSQHRWVAQLGDSLTLRIQDGNHTYGTNPAEPVPLRVQMVRAALLWPVSTRAGGYAMRAADVNRDGKEMRCLLLSAAVPPNPAPRSWYEREYCVDPTTGLLQTWSEAPGIFAVYNYDGAAEFHSHTIAREVSIYEEGRLAVQAHVESLEDAKDLDPNLFKPTPEMVDAGGSFALGFPNRFPMRVDPSDAPTSTYFQPVIVHAILDAQEGRVLDAEALQNSYPDLSRAAMDLVRNTSFEPSGLQQEVFINVQFHMPAAEAGGPPIFHSPVHWEIWDRRDKKPPVRKPVRLTN
ncbi:MAG TPA: energy transducer TonB [Candidatus Acidoferrales bacterium]